jgi:hypothetical protein
MSVTVIKLVTGEEIIAQVSQIDLERGISTDYITLEKPRIVALSQHQGEVMMQLIPFIKCDPDANFNCYTQSLAGKISGPVPSHIEKAYLEQTSGIQLIK